MQTLTDLISYVFYPNPGRTFSYYIVLVPLAVIILGFSIFLRIYIKKHKEDKAFKRLFRSFPTKLQIVGILLLTYLFFRYYTVTFLSMRVFLYMVLLGTAWVVYRMAHTYLKKYPSEKKQHDRQMAMNKYLPGRKN